MATQMIEDREFIQELSRSIIAENASDEVDLFEELAADYFRNPQPPKREERDDALGFGLETVMAFTPAVLAMAKVAFDFACSECLKAAKDEASEVIKRKVKTFFRKAKDTSAPTPAVTEAPAVTFTRAQLEQLRTIAINEGIAYGLKPHEAEKMSRSLIGSAALLG
jgi:hypothetical protein